MREIGSEFWLNETSLGEKNSFLDWLPKGSDRCFTFSGRTAIETIVSDIGNIRKVLFPSYCCDSMLEPFRRRNAKIEFYNVTFADRFVFDLHIPDDCNVLLWCNYFGYHSDYPQQEISEFQKRGGIVIEDITHSLLSDNQYHFGSDYTVASLRKWGALMSGGFCSKRKGCFSKKAQKEPDNSFIEQKKRAMKLKAQYVSSQLNDKEAFLELFSQSNAWLGENYSELVMDSLSFEWLKLWDIDEIRRTRRENAGVLHNAISGNPTCRVLFPAEDIDCPLFVPVVVNKENRLALRNELIKNNIYCPIHWPHPNEECTSELYDIELSLICDQRYTREDMLRIADIINNFRG